MNITLIESSITPIKTVERKRRSLMVDPIGLTQLYFGNSSNRSSASRGDGPSKASMSWSTASNDMSGKSTGGKLSEERTRRSCVSTKSIPISKSMKRTPSELQLMEDEALADYRDYCMYVRIVNGMRGGHNHHGGRLGTTEESVANIMRTRQMPVADSPSYLSYEERWNSPPPAINGNSHRQATAVTAKIEDACRITDNLVWPWSTTGQFYHYPYKQQQQQPCVIVEPEDDTSFDDGIFMMDL